MPRKAYTPAVRYNSISEIPGPGVTLSLPTPTSKAHLEWIKTDILRKVDRAQMFVNVQKSIRPTFLIDEGEAAQPPESWFNRNGECGMLHYREKEDQKNGFSYLDCKNPFDQSELIKPQNQGKGVSMVACEFDMPTDCLTLKNITCELYTPPGESQKCIIVKTPYAVINGTRLGDQKCRLNEPPFRGIKGDCDCESKPAEGIVITGELFEKYCNPDCEWSPWVSTKKKCDKDNPCETVRWTRYKTKNVADGSVKTCYGQPNESRPCSIVPTDKCCAVIEKMSIMVVLICSLIYVCNSAEGSLI